MELLCKRHAKYLKRCLDIIPGEFASLDTARITLLFYAVSGLDILGKLDLIENKDVLIDWIYKQQVVAPVEDGKAAAVGGFRGSPAGHTGAPLNRLDCGHVTMTYAALASLLVLGDDLSRLDRPALIAGLRALRRTDGSFLSSSRGGESDMRFVYCATAVCYMLNDWSAMDRPRTVQFIRDSMGFDCGISQAPGLESHGGSTFCACAALSLMDQLSTAFSQRQRDGLVRWCVNRQMSGFNGRPNKQEDTCYTFWVGATLQLLGGAGALDRDVLDEFVLGNQDPITGGLSKWPDHNPDPLHTYLGLSGLAVLGYPVLEEVNASLNISQRAADRLSSIHLRWSV